MSDKDTEHLEATIPNEEPEIEQEQDDAEDVEAFKAQLAEKEEQLIEKDAFARQAIARAKKAEEVAKSKGFEKDKDGNWVLPTQLKNTNSLTPDEIDARVLRLQGMPEQVLEALKKVAKINGQTLIDAQNDEVFLAMKAKIEETEKSEKAKLGASRGTGSVKKAKTFNTPGLTDAEHKELWRQAQGR